MTEVKIQFEKTEVEEVSNPQIPANVKALKLKISPINVGDYLNRFYEKVPPANTLKEINITLPIINDSLLSV